ncbi:MAG: hypothetical protein ACTHU0_23475 [Kofleriaceae bacterium]
MSNAARYLGTTDDVTTCECCGRTNLKRTVAISIDDADPVHFGVTCAAKALSTTAKEVKLGAKRADDAKATAERAARDAAWAAENAAWQAFLDRKVPEYAHSYMGGPDRHRQIAALGGYNAAREAFIREAMWRWVWRRT